MLKITSQNHTPIQIYQFFSKIGPMEVIISSGELLLNYSIIQHTYQCYQKYRKYMVSGKSAQIQKAYEWYTPQQQVHKQKMKQNFSKMQIEQKQLQNVSKHLAIIFKNKINILKFIQDYFQKIMTSTQNKLDDIKAVFGQDEVICSRQLQALYKQISYSCENIYTGFSNNVKALNNTINSFSVTKNHVIDLQSVIQQRQFKRKQLQANLFKIQQGIQYINLDKTVIKRVIAFSPEVFIMSQKNQKNNGQVKVYNKNQQAAKKVIDMQTGPYGLGGLNSMLIVGDSNGGISGHSLSFGKQIDSIPKQIHTPGSVIFDIRVFCSDNKRSMYTAATDSHIKLLSIHQQQITQDLFDFQYVAQRDHSVGDYIAAFETITPQIIAYASSNKLVFRNIMSQDARTHMYDTKITRIKNFNENLISFGDCKGFVSLMDRRTQKVVTKFVKVGQNISCLDISPPHHIFFGGYKAIGCFDDRKPNFIKWCNKKVHEDQVSDIAILSSNLISGDKSGKLVSWKF